MFNTVNTIGNIKAALIHSCINYEPHSFLPYLQSELIDTDMPSKDKFFVFFRYMLRLVKRNSKSELVLKIETVDDNPDLTFNYYNFYDNFHQNPRLSIIVKELSNKIFLEILPF